MRIILLTIFWLFNFLTIGMSQNIAIRPENSDGMLSFWVQNNYPCPITLSAIAPDTTFTIYIPNDEERLLFQKPDPHQTLFDELKETLEYEFIMGDPNAVHDDDYAYSLPFPEGSSYKLTQGNKTEFTHKNKFSEYAFDFSMPEGSYVSAARGGVVGFIETSNTEGGNDVKLIHNSNHIIVCHDDGTLAVYAHLLHEGALVAVGDRVFAGQVIGLSGNTGFTTSPHLHFSVLVADQSIPIRFRNEYTILYEGEVYEHK